MAERYLLSADDLDILRRIINSVDKTPKNKVGHKYHNLDDPPSPDVYIAYTPGGIQGRSGINAGYGDCDIYRISWQDNIPVLVQATTLQRVVNVGTDGINADSFFSVKRDKYGTWLADAFSSDSDVGTGTGTAVDPGASAAFSGAKVSCQSGQSIPNGGFGSETAIVFDFEAYDQGGYWSAGNPTRFTIPESGYYHVGGSALFDPSQTYTLQLLTIYRNGILAHDNEWQNHPHATGQDANRSSMWLAIDFFFTAGQYIELRVGQTNAGSANRLVSGGDAQFWIHKLGS